MAPRIIKILCLVLTAAALAGAFSGSQGIRLSVPDPTYSTVVDVPTTAVTVPTTVPEPTVPPTQPQPSEPKPEPEPEPLPPSAAYTLQSPAAQMPAKPNVAIPKLSADNYFIFDTRTNEFLYASCETDQALYPASITKLFTTYVALQYLDADTVVTVGSELSYVESDASVVGFRRGDRVSVEALAYGALLPSGCDASYILAAAAGRVILGNAKATAKNAISAFMAECNRIALELGMENTNFVTPDGYHSDQHKISMEAFAIIGKCSLENKLIARIASSASASVTYTNSKGSSTTRELQNTNLTIQTASKYYHDLSVGLKTGYTDAAGYCLLTAYEVDGRYILVGIFGCNSSNSRFQDANKLLNAYLPYL